MQCTADPCYGKLEYMGGENQEDFGCSNWFYRSNTDCRASKYIGFHTHVRVRKDWYYLAQYNLPFRWINSSNYRWYALRGDPESGETRLEGLKLRVQTHYDTIDWYEPEDDGRNNQHLVIRDKNCVQEHLFTVPYVALPANDDFKQQFALLRDRVMREWLRSRGMPTAVNPLYEEHNISARPALPVSSINGLSSFYDELLVITQRPTTRMRIAVPPVRRAFQLPDTVDDTMRQLLSSAIDNNSTTDAMEVCRRLDQIQRQKHSDKYQ